MNTYEYVNVYVNVYVGNFFIVSPDNFVKKQFVEFD